MSLRENLQDHIGSSGTFVARSNREPKPWPGCAPVDGPPAACPVGVDGERAVFDNEHRAAKRAVATASAAAADYRALNTGTRCPSAGSTRRVYQKWMPKKRRGRPRRIGRDRRDPVVAVRLPPKMIKAIARLADNLAMDRSNAVRWLLEQSLESGWVSSLLKRGTGRGLTGLLVAAQIAEYKAKTISVQAERATPRRKVETEIKALRAEEDALARTNALAMKQSPVETAVRPILTAKRHETTVRLPLGRRGPLSQAEIKACADRAENRSRTSARISGEADSPSAPQKPS